MSRIQLARLRAAAATALLTLTLAAPALANQDDWDDDSGRERGYPVHQHDRACDRDGRGGYGGRGDYYRDSDTQGRGHHYREESYGCRPCHRRWADEESFRRHLQRHHGVPYWAIPRVLVYADWGWLFLG